MSATAPTFPLDTIKPASHAASARRTAEILSNIEPLRFRTAPLLFAALTFAAGSAIARCVWISPGVAAIAALVLGCLTVFTLFTCRSRIALLPLAALWVMLGLFATEVRQEPDPQAHLTQLADAQPHRVQAEITRIGPVRRMVTTVPFSEQEREELSQSVDLNVRGIGSFGSPLSPVTGGVRFSLYSPVNQAIPLLHCGDVIEAEMTLRTPEHYRDPGVWDGRAWLLTQGIAALGSTRAEHVAVIQRAAHAPWPCRLRALQQSWSDRLISLADQPGRLPPAFRLGRDDAAMLSAMLTGDRTYLNRDVRAGFERTGSFHLLVVSGLHLGLFAALVMMTARRFRLHRVLTAALTLALASGYAVLTGFGQPVQRALFMIALYLLGRVLFRERTGLNAIGFAALCLLVISPGSLWEASLQMTLLSVIAIAGLVAPVLERTFGPFLRATRRLPVVGMDSTLPPYIAQFRVTLRLVADHIEPLLLLPRNRSHTAKRKGANRRAQNGLALLVRWSLRLLELVLVSATIELTMALPMAVYFHRITVYSLVVNVLIIPMLGLLLPLAFATLGTSLLLPKLAGVPAAATAVVLHLITAIITRFGHSSSGDFRVAGPTPALIAAGLALLACAVYAVRRPRHALLPGMASLVAAAMCAVMPAPIVRHDHVLEITAVDVGQGDALLVISPKGKTLLIDAGGPVGGMGGNRGNFEIGEDVVSPYLWSRHITRLDAVALTHAHSDHMGGMTAVLRNFQPRELWVGNNPEIPAYQQLLAQARSEGTTIRHFTAGDAFSFGEAQMHVLAPAADYIPGARASNNDSLVLHVAYGKTSALLEGDAEAPSEARMLSEPGLSADLLKVGHHGSKTSSIPPFLHAVAPRYAVISVGLQNSYHHPRWETLAHLQDLYTRTYRTDLLGLSTFYLDGATVFPEQH